MQDWADIEPPLSDPLVNKDFPGGLADSPTPNPSETQSGDIEDLWLQETIHLNDLKTSVSFIRVLQHITLDDPMLGMSDKVLEHLWNPLCDNPSLSINDDTRLAIRLLVADLMGIESVVHHMCINSCLVHW
jgi:hypothetical protein